MRVWNFYAATLRFDFDTFSTTATLYLNGRQVGQHILQDWFQPAVECGGLRIGSAFFERVEPGFCSMNIGDRFNATFDDVRVFNRALRPAEIRALYNEP